MDLVQTCRCRIGQKIRAEDCRSFPISLKTIYHDVTDLFIEFQFIEFHATEEEEGFIDTVAATYS